MMSLEQFEVMLSASMKTVVPRLGVALEKVGTFTEINARTIPGHYQPGWAQLADATIEDKVSKGFAVPSPLRRTSEMAESYKKDVNVPELMLVVGSPEKKALWQEVGTVNGSHSIPPRPVCEIAMTEALPFASKVLGELALSILTGKI
jgi:hypothetical protein